ncbi:MAG: DUF4783 domain-containing protein [Bacteroidota bacterium]
MKIKTAFFLTLFLTSAFQHPPLSSLVRVSLDQIQEAFQKADAHLLAEHFASSVEIGLRNDQKTYSKIQAEFVMRRFFQKNKVKEFIVLEQGRERNNHYVWAKYKTSSESYQMFLSLQGNGTSLLIRKIDIKKA